MTELNAHNSNEPRWIDPDAVYRKCPVCNTGHLDRRIPRDPFVKYALFWMRVRRYRCNHCGARVYMRKRNRKNNIH